MRVPLHLSHARNHRTACNCFLARGGVEYRTALGGRAWRGSQAAGRAWPCHRRGRAGGRPGLRARGNASGLRATEQKTWGVKRIFPTETDVLSEDRVDGVPMDWARTLILLPVTGLTVVGCTAQNSSSHSEVSEHSDSWKGLTKDEILDRFESRASREEADEFAEVATSRTLGSRYRAMELVLFRLTDAELFSIGITQVDQSGLLHWAVAWSADHGAQAEAVRGVLQRMGVGAIGSCGHGCEGWYVRRTDFFRVRQKLLEDGAVRTSGVNVVTPRFSFD
jgi:hypothetical protein